MSTTYTWHGAPAIVTATINPDRVVVRLPEGHAELGYLPESEFLADRAEVVDVTREPHRDHRAYSEGRVPGRDGAPVIAWFCPGCLTGGWDEA